MKNKAFTMIELLVYVGILLIVISVVAYCVSWGIRMNAKIRVNQEVLENAKLAMEEIVFEIRNSQGVYAPTSVFGTNPGQLSLKTTLNSPTGERETYLDFYLENDKIFLKKESHDPYPLTSEKVKVTNLVFKYLNPDISSSSIQIDLKVEYKNPSSDPRLQSWVFLTSSANLRIY